MASYSLLDESAYKTMTSSPLVDESTFTAMTSSPSFDESYVDMTPDYKTDYDEIKLLGEGNFGQVYEVIDKRDNKSYAIKKMLVDGSHKEMTKSIGHNFTQIQREIKCLKELKSEYIVEYIYDWKEDNCYYIQLEKCDTDLRKILELKHNMFQREKNGYIKLAEYVFSLELMKEISKGITYLHNAGHLHRDIKPENIMINFKSQNQYVKIGDFGLAVFHDIRNSIHSHTRMVGTFRYMAPEVHDKHYNFKSDIYSLAMVYSELFNKNIFKGDYKFDETIKEKAAILDEILKKMMITPNYNERYSCEEISKKLEKLNIERDLILKCNDYKQIELKRSESALNEFIFRFLSEKINGENYTNPLRRNLFTSFKKKLSFKRKSVENRLTIDRNEIDLLDKIGDGTYGSVHSGIWNVRSRVKIEVAIKILTEFDNQLIKSFLQEADSMRTLKHENILTFHGISYKSDKCPMIILPYFKRNLLSYLRDERNYPSVRELVNFVKDAAKGLQYLSEVNLVHRDISARNCMIADNLSVKITDYGLSRYMKNSNSNSNLQIQGDNKIRWKSIECIEKGVFNRKTDIWSYGVLVWEIFSFGKEPYPNLGNSSIYNHIKTGSRLLKPKICMDPLYDLILKCWSADPDNRPNFTDILLEIENKINTNEEQNVYESIDYTSSTYSENYELVPSTYLSIEAGRYAND